MRITRITAALISGVIALITAAPSHADSPRIEPSSESLCRSVQSLIPRTNPVLGGVVSPTFSLLVGDRGLILRGSPEGLDWNKVSSATSVMLTSAAVSNSGIALVVGHEQTILRSSDGGRSWSLVHHSPGTDAPLFDVAFISDELATAVGAYGTVLSSSDSGLTWTPVSLSEEEDRHAYALTEGAPGSWVMIGEAGLLYQRPSGADSRWQELLGAPSSSLFDAVRCPDQSLLAVGLNGRLYRSSAALDTWTSIENRIGSSLFTITSYGTGILLGGLGGVVVSAPSCDGPFSVAHTPERLALSAILPFDTGPTLLLGEYGVSCLPEERS